MTETKPKVKKFKKTKMALNGILGLASFVTIIIQILSFAKDLNNHLQIVSNLTNVKMKQVEIKNINLVADQKKLDIIVSIALILGFLAALSKFILMFLSGDVKYGTQIKIFLGLSFIINLLNVLYIISSKKEEEKSQKEKIAYMVFKFIFTLLSVLFSFFTLYHKSINGEGDGPNFIGSTNHTSFKMVKKMWNTKKGLLIGGGIGFIVIVIGVISLILWDKKENKSSDKEE
tara:strand:+ start:2194 stop:2886 length:693 start_codon:yes stop_codon:yes gene_type:complete